MIRTVKYAILVVIALILLLFAFANHEIVTVSFDPFGASDNAALLFARFRQNFRSPST